MYIHIYLYIYICIHIYDTILHICIHMFIRLYMYKCMHIYVCMYTIYIYIYIYRYTYTCKYIHSLCARVSPVLALMFRHITISFSVKNPCNTARHYELMSEQNGQSGRWAEK